MKYITFIIATVILGMIAAVGVASAQSPTPSPSPNTSPRPSVRPSATVVPIPSGAPRTGFGGSQ